MRPSVEKIPSFPNRAGRKIQTVSTLVVELMAQGWVAGEKRGGTRWVYRPAVSRAQGLAQIARWVVGELGEETWDGVGTWYRQRSTRFCAVRDSVGSRISRPPCLQEADPADGSAVNLSGLSRRFPSGSSRPSTRGACPAVATTRAAHSSEAQAALAGIALELVAITDRLQGIHDELPVSPNREAMSAHELARDVATEVYGTIEAVLVDELQPAIECLEAASRVTAEELRERFERDQRRQDG